MVTVAGPFTFRVARNFFLSPFRFTFDTRSIQARCVAERSNVPAKP